MTPRTQLEYALPSFGIKAKHADKVEAVASEYALPSFGIKAKREISSPPLTLEYALPSFGIKAKRYVKHPRLNLTRFGGLRSGLAGQISQLGKYRILVRSQRILQMQRSPKLASLLQAYL